MSNMSNPVQKESLLRSVSVEWVTNGTPQFVTLTEWGNKEGADFISHNVGSIQLTNQQLIALVNCVTKILMFRNVNN